MRFGISVVEQEKGEKPDQHPEHRAENSEPEWDVPARVGHGIRVCLGHSPGSFVSYFPLEATLKRVACPRQDARSRAGRGRFDNA
jgi:hypothetical protein